MRTESFLLTICSLLSMAHGDDASDLRAEEMQAWARGTQGLSLGLSIPTFSIPTYLSIPTMPLQPPPEGSAQSTGTVGKSAKSGKGLGKGKAKGKSATTTSSPVAAAAADESQGATTGKAGKVAKSGKALSKGAFKGKSATTAPSPISVIADAESLGTTAPVASPIGGKVGKSGKSSGEKKTSKAGKSSGKAMSAAPTISPSMTSAPDGSVESLALVSGRGGSSGGAIATLVIPTVCSLAFLWI